MDNKKKVLEMTIDSNRINAKECHVYMNKIEKLANNGKVKIFIASTMETEFLKGKGYQIGIDKLENYNMDIEIGVWGHSRYGSSKYGGTEDSKIFDEIKKILFPNINELTEEQIKDSMHLQTHFNYKRDYFLTDDKKHILNKKNQLKSRLNIEVCTPKEFCENIWKEDC